LGAPEPSDVRRLVPKEAGKLVVAEKSFAESMREIPEWLSMKSVPRSAQLLGLAGLIPFVALNPAVRHHLETACAFLPQDAGSWLLQHADSLLVSYGISIASFLGGVHWGAALSGTAGPSVTARLVWGVAPSVLAFPAIAVPSPWNFALLANVLVVLAHADFYYAIKVSYANNACRLSVACSKVRRVRYATLTPALGCRTSILAASPCCVCR